jgi:hypothetical protein
LLRCYAVDSATWLSSQPGLDEVFEEIAYRRNLEEMIRRGKGTAHEFHTCR